VGRAGTQRYVRFRVGEPVEWLFYVCGPKVTAINAKQEDEAYGDSGH
jgi:hypothetical protein